MFYHTVKPRKHHELLQSDYHTVWSSSFEKPLSLVTDNETHDRGSIAKIKTKECIISQHVSDYRFLLLQFLIFKLVVGNSVGSAWNPDYCRSYSSLSWQQIPWCRSVVPENIPKVHKKNRHSYSLTHKLRNCNFVAWAKRFYLDTMTEVFCSSWSQFLCLNRSHLLLPFETRDSKNII